jgi:BirA family biotin operon repressor/biotin-[acetyl-CoA-carboxylase] ligase|tara:strand:- start:3908 stop:4720 length:813 start_codon:yes stop_codon:yes gene_type:complete
MIKDFFSQPEGLQSLSGEVTILHSVDSTQIFAASLAREGTSDGASVVAEIQTKARGRFGHDWYSPSGGLWVSVILKPSSAPARLPLLSIAGACAVCEAIEDVTKLDSVGIKWPNDVVIRGRKIGGVILEASFKSRKLEYAILGAGINVNIPTTSFPSELRESATSLCILTGRNYPLSPLFNSFRRSLDKLYLKYTNKQDQAIQQVIQTRILGIGSRVKMRLSGKTTSGLVKGIDVDAGLVIENDQNKILTIYDRDVESLTFLGDRDKASN